MAQNFARELTESPSNHMTPTRFVDAVSSRLGEVVREGGEPGRLAIIPRSGPVPEYCKWCTLNVYNIVLNNYV